jgi:hypothetical protein
VRLLAECSRGAVRLYYCCTSLHGSRYPGIQIGIMFQLYTSVSGPQHPAVAGAFLPSLSVPIGSQWVQTPGHGGPIASHNHQSMLMRRGVLALTGAHLAACAIHRSARPRLDAALRCRCCRGRR